MEFTLKLIKDWIKLLMDDHFQQDLIFLLILFVGLSFNLYSEETFRMLFAVIVGGDAVKKLGK